MITTTLGIQMPQRINMSLSPAGFKGEARVRHEAAGEEDSALEAIGDEDELGGISAVFGSSRCTSSIWPIPRRYGVVMLPSWHYVHRIVRMMFVFVLDENHAGGVCDGYLLLV